MSVGRFATPTVAPTAPSGIAYSFGRILWSGQTTSYRTGDEGWQLANSFFDYTRPAVPAVWAELGADFNTLASNNVHGNTNRFTARDGSAYATTGNRVIRDHLTGLEWYIPGTLFTAATWNNAIDAAEAFSDGTYSDWHIPNDKMIDSITNDGTSSPLNHGPFLITSDLWTATTNPADTAQARRYLISAGGGIFSNLAKTGTITYIYCRKFIND